MSILLCAYRVFLVAVNSGGVIVAFSCFATIFSTFYRFCTCLSVLFFNHSYHGNIILH